MAFPNFATSHWKLPGELWPKDGAPKVSQALWVYWPLELNRWSSLWHKYKDLYGTNMHLSWEKKKFYHHSFSINISALVLCLSFCVFYRFWIYLGPFHEVSFSTVVTYWYWNLFHLFSHTNPYDPHVIAKCLRNTQGLHYKGLNRLIELGLPVVALNEDSTSTQLFSK